MPISKIEIEIPDALDVKISGEALTLDLSDGRIISVPLIWYPRLMHASFEELGHWRFIGNGQGIHWEDLDEDISVENVLAGRPSGESQSSLKRWFETRNKK